MSNKKPGKSISFFFIQMLSSHQRQPQSCGTHDRPHEREERNMKKLTLAIALALIVSLLCTSALA